MAVYTVLDQSEIAAFIKPFGIGSLIDFEGVSAGIENSNYFIRCDQSHFLSELQTTPHREFVLTLFESASHDDLQFFCQLTTLLSQQGLPVPCPISNADGIAIGQLKGKPAMLVPKVAGRHLQTINSEHCRQIASTLASIHLQCQRAELHHPTSYSLAWLEQCAQRLSPQLAADDVALLAEIERFRLLSEQHPNLPRTVIHGDLFRDNALFDGENLTAIIDFNSAGDGYLLFDVAVLVNDWCSTVDGGLDAERVDAVLAAYQQVRVFTDDEKKLWNDFLRIAATSFWISRLQTQLQPDQPQLRGALVEQKDPQQYKNILLSRIRHPQQL